MAKYNHLELPSGTIEPSEKLINGVVREIKEETGLEVVCVKFFIDSFDYKSASGKKTRQFNFLVEVADGEVVLNSKEHSKYIFVDPKTEDLDKVNVSQSVKESIYKSFNLKFNPAIFEALF